MDPPGIRFAAPRIARVRFLLRATGLVKLAVYGGGQLKGVLPEVFERAGGPRAIPDGLLPIVCEQGRFEARAGEPFVFGVDLLGHEGFKARRVIDDLTRGLESLGRSKRRKADGLGGNFSVVDVEDLVGQRSLLADSHDPATIPIEAFRTDARNLARRRRHPLLFRTPLRITRRSNDVTEGHNYFDGELFDGRHFMRRLMHRLRALGWIEADDDAIEQRVQVARATNNRLVWMDFHHGLGKDRKRLGGCLGRIHLDFHDPDLVWCLILGQYARVGQKLNFGFGHYELLHARNSRIACPRAESLLELYLADRSAGIPADARAQADEIAPGELRTRRRQVLDGRYDRARFRRLLLERPGKGPRVLSIPDPVDRALQRLVLERLAPALNGIFEQSSFAFRRGLGRTEAARRVKRLVERGFTHALKADFERFFDSVEHSRLHALLDAYLASDPLVDLIMFWTKAGAPQEGLGLPTGSPLSPVLANLFLDRFDESVTRTGARLVRYADDFLLLFEREEDAQRVHDSAREIAAGIALQLNSDKTHQVDLRERFEFLGFEFFWRDNWQLDAPDGPRHVRELGWRQADPRPSEGPGLPLPGETGAREDSLESAVLVGSDVKRIHCAANELVFQRVAGRSAVRFPLERIRELILERPIAVEASALAALLEADIPAWFLGYGSADLAYLCSADSLASGDLALAQAAVLGDETRSLPLARALVRAKLANHAMLAKEATGLGTELPADLAKQAGLASRAANTGALRGIEGAAARMWFEGFERLLPDRFHFPGRRRPAANDPINALLNFGYSLLFRATFLSVRRARLVESVGCLHRPRRGHPSLVSDLMEPFRHLGDRRVLLSARDLTHRDFKRVGTPPRMHLRRAARRRFVQAWLDDLAHLVTIGSDTRSYREWIDVQTRSYRRAVSDPEQRFRSFEQNTDPTAG